MGPCFPQGGGEKGFPFLKKKGQGFLGGDLKRQFPPNKTAKNSVFWLKGKPNSPIQGGFFLDPFFWGPGGSQPYRNVFPLGGRGWGIPGKGNIFPWGGQYTLVGQGRNVSPPTSKISSYCCPVLEKFFFGCNQRHGGFRREGTMSRFGVRHTLVILAR